MRVSGRSADSSDDRWANTEPDANTNDAIAATLASPETLLAGFRLIATNPENDPVCWSSGPKQSSGFVAFRKPYSVFEFGRPFFKVRHCRLALILPADNVTLQAGFHRERIGLRYLPGRIDK